MKSAAEWSNDYFFGKKIGTIAELVREVRAEILDEAERAIRKLDDGDVRHSMSEAEEAVSQLRKTI